MRALLCLNDKFNPQHNRIMISRRRTSFPEEVCFDNEQLLHPVKSTAWKVCQCDSIDKPKLPRTSGFLSISDFHINFNFFEEQIVLVKIITKFSLSVSVLKSKHTFLLPLGTVRFRKKKFFSGISFFNVWYLLNFN